MPSSFLPYSLWRPASHVQRREPEGAAEAHVGPGDEPRARSVVQVGLREQAVEVNRQWPVLSDSVWHERG